MELTGNSAGLRKAKPWNSETVPKTIFDIPVMVQNLILDYLNIRTILNLRLTNSGMFEWVNDYLNLKKRLSSYKIILLDANLFKKYSDSIHALPFTSFRIYFNILEDRTSLDKFKTFAPSIHSLEIHTMNCCMNDEEYELYNSMKSLKSLKVYVITCPSSDLNRTLNRNEYSMCSTPRIPESFVKTLESFKCVECYSSFYPHAIIVSCPRLKIISTPTFRGSTRTRFLRLTPDALYNEEISKLTQVLNQKKPKDLSIYMKWCEGDWTRFNRLDKTVGCDFLKAIGSSPGVKLRSANTTLVDMIGKNKRELNEPTLKNILQSIVNLRGICPAIQMYEMGNLKTLEFLMNDHLMSRGYHNGFVKDWSAVKRSSVYPVWPNLQKIHAKISLHQQDEQETTDVLGMLNFLLMPPQERPNVTDLAIEFRPVAFRLTPEHFTINFPNLVKLSLSYVKFKRSEYSRLFVLLGIHTKIQNLELISYYVLDEDIFIHSTEEDDVPDFVKLKHLRNFGLFYEIPFPLHQPRVVGITDSLLTDVFALMSLETLIISGGDPAQVTEEGFNSLADGELGKNVCYFSIELPRVLRRKSKKAYDRLWNICEINRARRPKVTRVLHDDED